LALVTDRPDLMILDLGLPDIDRVEARQVRGGLNSILILSSGIWRQSARWTPGPIIAQPAFGTKGCGPAAGPCAERLRPPLNRFCGEVNESTGTSMVLLAGRRSLYPNGILALKTSAGAGKC
jgi:hypothetical protein